MSGSAQGWGRTGESIQSGNLSIDGAGVSHNPALPGDVQYGGRYTRVMGAGFLYYPAPDSSGSLHLFERDGKHRYEIYFGIAQIFADYRTYDRVDSICHPYGGVRREESYDNRTQTTTTDYSTPLECHQDDDTTHYDSPYTFGALVPYRQHPDPVTGSSGWIGGLYDPKLGVLEGEETVNVSNCEEVMLYDPLALGDIMPVTGPMSAISQGGSAACNIIYNLSWRLEIPQSGR